MPQFSPNSKQRRRIPVLFICIIIAVLLIVSLAILLMGNIFNNPRVTLSQCLEKKYGKEFIVTNVTKNGYIGNYYWQGEAYPKDNPDVKFSVSGTYCEADYPEQLWGYQALPEFKSDMADVIPLKAEVDINIYPHIRPNSVRSSQDIDTKNIPSYDEIYKKHAESIAYVARIVANGRWNSKIQAEHVRNIHTILSYLRSLDVKNVSVRYVVNVVDTNYRYICIASGDSKDGEKTASENDANNCFEKYSGKE